MALPITTSTSIVLSSAFTQLLIEHVDRDLVSPTWQGILNVYPGRGLDGGDPGWSIHRLPLDDAPDAWPSSANSKRATHPTAWGLGHVAVAGCHLQCEQLCVISASSSSGCVIVAARVQLGKPRRRSAGAPTDRAHRDELAAHAAIAEHRIGAVLGVAVEDGNLGDWLILGRVIPDCATMVATGDGEL